MSDYAEIATALAAFQGEMPTVAKSKTATVPMKSGGKFSYTYADLADVTEVAMPLLSKHGLSFTCRPTKGENGPEAVGMLLHKSGEYIEATLPIRGSSLQEIGGSLTYCRRYLLGCLTGIVTEDDNDASGQQGATKQARAAAVRPDGPPQRMSRRPAPEPPLTSTTGNEITKDQLKALHAALNAAGITDRDAGLAYYAKLLGHDVGSSKDLTRAEASRVIDALKADTAEPAPDDADQAWVAGEES